MSLFLMKETRVTEPVFISSSFSCCIKISIEISVVYLIFTTFSYKVSLLSIYLAA